MPSHRGWCGKDGPSDCLQPSPVCQEGIWHMGKLRHRRLTDLHKGMCSYLGMALYLSTGALDLGPCPRQLGTSENTGLNSEVWSGSTGLMLAGKVTSRRTK